MTLEVFDLAGRLVATPIRDEPLASGPHQVEFARVGLPSGLYLSRLKTGRDVRLLMAIWLAAIVVFFSLPRSKLVGYALPAAVPLPAYRVKLKWMPE